MSERCWVLICGVAKYLDTSMPQLPGVAHDATTFWWTLETYADGGVYRQVQLHDGEATKERIRDELKIIADHAKATDQIVIYFAGHGAHYTNVDRQPVYCVLPYEASFATAESHGLTIAEISGALKQLRTTKIVLVFDCCFSGGLLEDFQDYLTSLSAGRKNLYLMASARQSELSYEDDSGGVFTQAVCAGLRGEGVVPNADGRISLFAAWAYASAVVVRQNGIQQHPVHAGYGEDIYLTRRTHPLLKPQFQHPYAADKYFTGRAAERPQLTEWFIEPTADPLLVVEALGGMGKSALAWKWVHADLLKRGLHPDGVLWWSFYEPEATFANFVSTALAYFGVPNVPPDLDATRRWQHLVEIMSERRCLVILDGVERLLHAYNLDSSADGHPRDGVSPAFGRFLLYFLAHAERAKLLLTTILPPHELDRVRGWRSLKLQPLPQDDLVAYFREYGVTEDRATRAEIAEAGQRFGYHPLSLTQAIERLLNDLLARRNLHEITFQQLTLIPTEPQRSRHILETPFLALDPSIRDLLFRLAAFHGPIDLTAVKQVTEETGFLAFLRRLPPLLGVIPGRPASSVIAEESLTVLKELGFLLRAEDGTFFLPRLVREYAYLHLHNKQHIHGRLYRASVRQEPSALGVAPTPHDLNAAIERYRQTVAVGRFDEAYGFFCRHLEEPLYRQLKAYLVHRDLLQALFPDGLDQRPRLTTRKAQAWVMNALANSYAHSGRAREAVQLYTRHNALQEKMRNHAALVVGLRNRAEQELTLGNIAAAEEQLRQSLALAQEIKDVTAEAAGQQALSLLFSYKGEFKQAEEALVVSSLRHQRDSNAQASFVDILYRTRRGLLLGDAEEALQSARVAQERREATTEASVVSEYEAMEAQWVLGAALVAQALNNENQSSQEQDPTKILTEAESHLNRALELCQQFNFVEWEAQILVEQARLRWGQDNAREASRLGQEALFIANRYEYRLQQAEAHNLLARLQMESLYEQKSDIGGKPDQTTLALAREHAARGKERAWCDGPPHCYKPALEEAEQLLTEIQTVDKQRIEGGTPPERRHVFPFATS
ncbi:MAG: caspase family protein [Deltaproteobacteria bacterium]|nr:caspase family protein [Deltaproteobacteria bacterium]